MDRAIALVGASFPAARSEESAGPEVAPECVEVTVCSHGVTLPQDQPNQWIISLVVRLEYTRAAALAEIMSVV
jgi:hypothetical protein